MAYQVVKEPSFKQILLKAQKLEAIAIGIVQFYHMIAYEQTTVDTLTSVNTYLKNLMFYVHQKFLIVIGIAVARIVAKGVSSWEEQLKAIVAEKSLRKLKNKEEAMQMLRVYSLNCENIIRNMCKANQNKRIFKLISEWLVNLKSVPMDRIRDVLYNVDQFKQDAFKLPEIQNKVSTSKQNKTTSSNVANTRKGEQVDGPVYGQGARSAGSLHAEKSGPTKMAAGASQGQTPLTGKNPFAILKASAIASTQSAVFPNHFQNLPKATPPFLLPQQSAPYTLVLDLDETLIHNVEYGNDSYFLVRPGCVQFIEAMAKHYEIVIFTAALQEYAD